MKDSFFFKYDFYPPTIQDHYYRFNVAIFPLIGTKEYAYYVNKQFRNNKSAYSISSPYNVTGPLNKEFILTDVIQMEGDDIKLETYCEKKHGWIFNSFT